MKKVKLGDVCKIQSGGTPSRGNLNYWNNGNIPWVKISDIKEKYLSRTEEFITQEGLANSSAKIFPKETILYTIFATLGEVSILGIEATTNQAIAGLQIIDENICKDYLYYYLISLKPFVNEIGRGVAQNNINMQILRNFEIPLPSLEEQKAIARKLDKVSGLIEKRKTQHAKLSELVKSRFIEMFGEPESNPLHWKMLPLENCLTVLGGYAFKSEEFKTSGVPVLRIGNINTGVFTPTNMVYWAEDASLERYQVLPGDLVISLTGTVGKDDYGNVCILGNTYPLYYLNQRNAKLILGESLNKHYLSELLKFSQIKKKLTGISRGVRQANISNRDILNLVVPIPPIELQTQFATFVEQTDKSKFEIQKSLEKLETLKKALMQKYFG